MKELFSVSDIAKLLDVSHTTILYYIKTGKLKATQVGKVYIITLDDFGDFLKNHRSGKRHKDSQTSLDF